MAKKKPEFTKKEEMGFIARYLRELADNEKVVAAKEAEHYSNLAKLRPDIPGFSRAELDLIGTSGAYHKELARAMRLAARMLDKAKKKV